MTRYGLTLLALAAIGASRASAQTIQRVSVATSGLEANDASGRASMSADGRWVLFESAASTLVPDDRNAAHDVFLRDRVAGTTVRVNVAADGSEANADTMFADTTLSADGRYAAFVTSATNLDPSGLSGLILRDLATGANRMIVATQTGGTLRWGFQPSLSADGRWLAYLLYEYTGVQGWEVHVFDRESGADVRLPVSRRSLVPRISADGRFVAFQYTPSQTAFSAVYDRETGVQIELARNAAGFAANDSVIGPTISGDGRWALFESRATNLVPEGDANPDFDVFLRDLATGDVTLVSVSSTGEQGIGRNDVGAISFDGRFLAFSSNASNLVSDDQNGTTDLFVRDRLTGETRRIVFATNGGESNGPSQVYGGSFTRDGGQLVFLSGASNLVSDDTNDVTDVFVWSDRRVAIADVRPSSGSEAGGELVHLFGENLAPGSSALAFGGVTAEIVGGDDGHLVARTPPGAGTADVTLSGLHGAATLAGAYTYVDPTLAARFGNVGTGAGDREAIVLVNGIAGDPQTREIRVASTQALTCTIVAPSSRTASRFVAWAWRGVPTASTRTPLPGLDGALTFPAPFVAGAPAPLAIWNNIGHRRTFGTPTASSRPAPTILFAAPHGAGRAARVTLQGLVEDSASPSGVGLSVTNAIVLRIDR
jgi:Tol biopolymer transport system component